ncbi:hypothetical protein L914_11423 [Phytophthora nicotianae]|uniref:Uncharacterized protein n=1 Tax=Phytophthora nicotianae TaxID=4792 RepID=W2N552_PHYNI|nr:hypothetical protein L914_11423 [Phytophthora nicotianae]
MGVITRLLLLLELCVLVYVSRTTGESEVEVALDAAGSIVHENRPLEAVAEANSDPAEQSSVNEAETVGESMKSDSPFHESDVVPLMTTLQRELTAVEQMVKLQEKKLQVLREMRSVWLQETQLPQDEEMPKRRRQVDIVELIERRLDAAIAETLTKSTTSAFDTHFVEKSTITLEGEVVDMKMKVLGAVELIAVAYRSGIAVFYLEVEELLRIDTEKQGIERIALEFQEDQPCLVVMYETPEIAVYELKLVTRSTSYDAQEPKFTVAVVPELMLSVKESRILQLPKKASALAIARSSRQLVMAVSQVDGIINFLALNGTNFRQLQTNASISAMEARRNLLVFSNNTDVVISSVTRAQGSVFHICPGSSAKVSSITFDAMVPEIMYIGTQRGEILVYAVNAGAPAEAQVCRLLSRSFITKTSQDTAPVVLVTTKTYITAATPQNIGVFNVSKTQRDGAFLSKICSIKRMNPTENHQLSLPIMAFSQGTLGSHLAIINGQDKLTLYHCLLPDVREPSDLHWTVYLYAIIAIVAVIGSQLFIRWQRRSSVNPWDSIGKPRDSPYEKYGDLKDDDDEFDGDFGQYSYLSDELRNRIAQEKKGSTRTEEDVDY